MKLGCIDVTVYIASCYPSDQVVPHAGDDTCTHMPIGQLGTVGVMLCPRRGTLLLTHLYYILTNAKQLHACK